MRTGAVLSLVMAALALPCCGCGSSSSRQLPLTLPVRGKVTYRGKPLTEGKVKFEPDAGRSASGHIHSDGTYVLTTFKEGDGAVPGVHRVAVTGGTGKSQGETVPPKFRSVSSSKIEIEVVEGTTEYPINIE
ncbi:MAG: hypothetical protein P4L84_20550 [Isosphaeraceae bacterium]|nr:hypothetical protein [Isosphaeraceae bacterium]